MKAPTNKEERAARDADFAQRMEPRMVWPRDAGTAKRTSKGYVPFQRPAKKSKARKLTEAEDNALGRVARRRVNRRARRAGKPHSTR